MVFQIDSFVSCFRKADWSIANFHDYFQKQVPNVFYKIQNTTISDRNDRTVLLEFVQVFDSLQYCLFDICMYVCMPVFICVHVCISMCISLYVCISLCVYISICVYISPGAYVSLSTCKESFHDDMSEY